MIYFTNFIINFTINYFNYFTLHLAISLGSFS